MSDVNLHGVLNMPPELWQDNDLDKMQRYSRYLEASRRIEDQERELTELKRKAAAFDLIEEDFTKFAHAYFNGLPHTNPLITDELTKALYDEDATLLEACEKAMEEL